jgi:hypothetical protein
MDRFFEIMQGNPRIKLISIGLLVFGGICFVVIRKIVSVAEKGSMHKLIISLKSRPALGKELSASLDIPYAEKINFNSDAFNRLSSYLKTISTAGGYTILFSMSIDSGTLLVLTEFTYIDYDINIVGSASNTRKKAYHSFVLTHNKTEDKMFVLSNLYSDTTNRFQKEEFLRAVFEGK